MLPIWHFLISLVSGIFLYFIYGVNILWIIIGNVLIDIDHLYIYYKYAKRFGLKEAYSYISHPKKGKKIECTLCMFHTIEFLIILGILSFYNKILFFIFLGFLIHITSDLVFDLIIFKRSTKHLSIIFRKKI